MVEHSQLVWLHTLIELPIAAILWMIGLRTWKLYRVEGWLVYMIWAFAFWITSIEDGAHAVLSLLFADTLMPQWVAGTWATSRMTLHTLILLGVPFATLRYNSRDQTFASGLIIVAALGACAFMMPGVLDYSGTYKAASLHRPMDLLLVPLCVISAVAITTMPNATERAPKWFAVALAIGVMLHIIMAFFSAKPLDAAFFAAHVLQVLEYGIWLAFTPKVVTKVQHELL